MYLCPKIASISLQNKMHYSVIFVELYVPVTKVSFLFIFCWKLGGGEYEDERNEELPLRLEPGTKDCIISNSCSLLATFL